MDDFVLRTSTVHETGREVQRGTVSEVPVHVQFKRLDVIYQTRERMFHQDIQTPRSGLKRRGATEFF